MEVALTPRFGIDRRRDRNARSLQPSVLAVDVVNDEDHEQAVGGVSAQVVGLEGLQPGAQEMRLKPASGLDSETKPSLAISSTNPTWSRANCADACSSATLSDSADVVIFMSPSLVWCWKRSFPEPRFARVSTLRGRAVSRPP